MVKDSTEYFLGIFFGTSFIYFCFLFYALKDKKVNIIKEIFSTNKLGEKERVYKSDSKLINLN